jgi:thioredoxin-dependent peroxiredoxin
MDFPLLSLAATSGQTFDTQTLRGQRFVLSFYPKDSTSGCTQQMEDMARSHSEFMALGCHVFGISRDSLKSHERFKAALGLPFELVCDKEELACVALDVIKPKKMYGKDVKGIERSTFVVDEQGTIQAALRGLKPLEHAPAALEALRALPPLPGT